jgi:soluble lytic murein transglycosylase-like protein
LAGEDAVNLPEVVTDGRGLLVRRGLLAVLIALSVAGCAGQKGNTDALDAGASPTASAPAEAEESAAAPPSTVAGVGKLGKAPAAKPSATRRSTAPRPAPSPSRRPVTVSGARPPAPEPAPVTDRPCPYHEGTDAARSDVKAALVAAANTRVWSGQAVSAAAKEITVPVNLMKATAWQESGWQSTIIACDGGIGTMQIMPATEDWMNARFGTSYDAHTLSGNTKIGAALLEWLIYYFGHFYFADDFTLDPADCPDVGSPCLLNAVIAAYNYGYGAVDVGDHIEIPNPQYVRNVRALMTGCTCLSF